MQLGIQYILGFWNPRRGFRIPVTEFRILWQWNVDSELQSLVRFRTPCAVFLIPKPKTLDSTRNISRIPESGSLALHGVKGLMS